MSLAKLFHPSSVAVIGASRKKGQVGREVLTNLKETFEGKIFPVNPKAESLEGLKCYENISKVPSQVDLAVIAVPAAIVPEVLKECSDSGIKNVIVVSGGFKEIGEEGKKLEQQLSSIANDNHINLIGPNALGVISTESSLNATFAQSMAIPGNISFMSQSGAFCTAVLDWANEVGMGFNHFVSLGNKAVLDEIDLIEEWDQDERTEVILAYLEGIERGKEFIEITRDITKTTPVVVVKSGRTKQGATAAASHTGTLTGRDNAYDAAFLQSGVIRAEDIEELFDFGSILAHQSPPENKKVGILTNAGGPGVMAADALEDYGLDLAEFEPSTSNQLEGVLSSLASGNNPVDLTGKASEDDYREALKYMIKDPNVGSVLAMSAPAAIFSYPELAEILAEAKNRTEKPIVGSLMGGRLDPQARDSLKTAGIPNYFDPARAVRALSALEKYGEIKNKKFRPPANFNLEKSKVECEITKLKNSSPQVVGLEGLDLLEAYGIPVVAAKLAKTADEAGSIAKRLESSVVLKVDSPEISHKSDVGGVKVGVKRDRAAVEFDEMIERMKKVRPNAQINGVRIQELAEGEEVIVGMKRDPQFGPLLMFGLGGIYVEVLEDVSFGVTPISAPEVRKMIKSIDAFPILEGVRGKQGVKLDSLVSIIQRIAKLSLDNPEIEELDLNPVMASSEGAKVVDVRFKFSN